MCGGTCGDSELVELGWGFLSQLDCCIGVFLTDWRTCEFVSEVRKASIRYLGS